MLTRARISATLAAISGLLLTGMETYINWGQWQWWPYWLVDYAGAALLLIGAFQTFSGQDRGVRWLCAGWAFCLGMGWMSLAGNFEAGPDPERAARVGGHYLALLAAGLAIALTGFLTALTASTSPSD